jgi:dipeptidyl aminopeptidase/acylaminoacyl peptidase
MRGIYSSSKTFEHLDRVGKMFVKTGHGGLPDEQPEAYAASNVIKRIKNIQVPVLIMHGEADQRAPFLNYKLAVEELERQGKEFESKSYPGEGHGFSASSSVDMYGRLKAFFDKHLKQESTSGSK